LTQERLFEAYTFGAEERSQLDRDGHFAFPGLLTAHARSRLTDSLEHISALPNTGDFTPQRYSAEYDSYLASLIAHPQLLDMARGVLGKSIRFDHCVALTRPSGDRGIGWHSHDYANDRTDLGFIRIFFYVNGFSPDDGGLKVVPGSHLFRDSYLRAASDEELRSGWMAGKTHPLTGARLEIIPLEAPPGTVILMWTHAAHAVTPRRLGSDTRWSVVYAYRNPGEPSRARWITEGFQNDPPPGTEALMPLL